MCGAPLPSCDRKANSIPGTAQIGHPPGRPDKVTAMEAVFISLMALVVLLSGWVSLMVLYKLFKTQT